jgi:hypothetical protein
MHISDWRYAISIKFAWKTSQGLGENSYVLKPEILLALLLTVTHCISFNYGHRQKFDSQYGLPKIRNINRRVLAIQLTYSYRKELRIRAEFSASHRIILKLVQTEISFPCATTSNDIQSGGRHSQSVGGQSGSIGLETEKAVIWYSACISRIAEDSVAESRSRLQSSRSTSSQCEKAARCACWHTAIGRPLLKGVVISDHSSNCRLRRVVILILVKYSILRLNQCSCVIFN